jgi:murein L,D-transpeptidase YafK
MTKAKHNISFVYKESLRAMIASFNDVGYIDSEEKFNDIKCIYANAERSVAKLFQENNIILPILSVSQTISEDDTERQRSESILVHEKYWDESKHRAIRVLSFAPKAVNITYQLNVWSKYASDMDQIAEQVRLKFNPEMNVPTSFSTLAKAYITSEEDAGQVTATDKEDRILKKTFNIVFRTYIPNPKFLVTSTGEIEELKEE